MRCAKVQENLLAYVKHEDLSLPPECIRQHIAVCTICKTQYDSISDFIQIFNGLPSIHPRPNFTGLSTKLEYFSENAPTSRPLFSSIRKPSFWYALGTAACVLISIYFLFPYFISRNIFPMEILQGKIRINGILAIQNSVVFHQGVELSTPEGKTARCKLSEDILCIFGRDTRIKIENINKIELQKGEIFCKVKPGKKLIIKTPSGEAHVGGTIFSILISSMGVILRVVEGIVHFRNLSGAVDVKNKEFVRAIDNKTIFYHDKWEEADFPWWEENPLSLSLDFPLSPKYPHSLCIHLKNGGNQKITFAPFSGGTPRLLLHVGTKGKSYSTPLRTYLENVNRTPVTIEPMEDYLFCCNLSPLLKENGKYIFTVIYQWDSEHGKRGGILCSIPLEIRIP